MKTKYRLESIAFYDTEALSVHLGEMAALGWELESVGLLLWKYRKIQPEKRTYGITFFSDASEVKDSPTQTQGDFIAEQTKKDWQYVTQWNQMQIFQTTAEHPAPLSANENQRLDAVKKSMATTFLLPHILLLFGFLLQIAYNAKQIYLHPATYITDRIMLDVLLVQILTAGYGVISCLIYWRWYKKSLAAVTAGGNCLSVKKGQRIFAKIPYLPLGFLFLWSFLPDLQPFVGAASSGIALTMVALGILFAGKTLLGNGKASSAALSCMAVVLVISVVFINRHLTIARDPLIGKPLVLAENPPLTMEQLKEGEADTDTYVTFTEESTIFAAVQSYTQWDGAKNPIMDYTILDLSYEALVDPCVDTCLYRRDDWGTPHPYASQKSLTLDSADAAWQLYEDGQTWQTYLLQKDNRLVSLSFFKYVTPEELEAAASVLLAEP